MLGGDAARRSGAGDDEQVDPLQVVQPGRGHVPEVLAQEHSYAGEPALGNGESLSRGWLGIAIDPRAPDAVVILNVAIPSPMHQAGVEPGDRIVSAAGKAVRNYGDLVKAIYMIPAGERISLRVARDDQEFEVEVTLARSTELGELPDLAEPFDPSAPMPEPDEE